MSSGSAGNNCSLLSAPINSTAAWLQSDRTPVSGSYNQLASALRLNRRSNTLSLSPIHAPGALVLSPRSLASDAFMTGKPNPHDRHLDLSRNVVLVDSDRLRTMPVACRSNTQTASRLTHRWFLSPGFCAELSWRNFVR